MLRAIATSLRSRYLQSLEKRTAALDPQTRVNLARDVHDSTVVGVNELHEVNALIDQAQLSLDELEEKKRFISVRLISYREKLEREEERINGACSEQYGRVESWQDELQDESKPLAAGSQDRLEHGEVECSTQSDGLTGDEKEWEPNGLSRAQSEVAEIESRLKRDQIALKRVEKSYRVMEDNARELQKRIFVLERTRDELLSKIGEGRDFVVAAANVEQREAQDDDTVTSEDDPEEGYLAEENDEINGLMNT